MCIAAWGCSPLCWVLVRPHLCDSISLRVLRQHLLPCSTRRPGMADGKIDRTKVCPLLLRCFWTQHRHRRGQDYSNANDLPRDELQIYTWPDATIREITTLIQGVVPAARRRQGRLSYAFVYPDSQGKQVLRQVASAFSVSEGQDDNKTLKDLKFQTGDYMEVAIA